MDGTLKNLTLEDLLSRGIALHKAGDLLSAESDYRQICLEQPNHPEANHNIALLLTLQGNLEGALDHLKICLDASPNVSLYWATYIDVLVKLERISDAKTLLIKTRENGLWHPSMLKIDDYITSLDWEPSRKDFLEIEKLIGSSQIKAAIDVCDILLEEFPASSKLNHYLGQCFLKANDINSSMNAYQNVVELSPNWYLGFMMLGHLNLMKENETKPLNILKKLLI